MSDTGDVPELQELEPIDTPANGGQAPQTMSLAEATLLQMRAGMAPPAMNPRAGKEYYKFLLAGVLMLLGCLMPFGPEWEMAGYKTLSGALFTFISLGLVWSWWGAIHQNRFGPAQLKWVGLAVIPFIVQLMNLIGAFGAPAVANWPRGNGPIASSWGGLFDAMKGSIPFLAADQESQMRAALEVENFFRAFGTGKVVLFVGSLLTVVFFFTAVMGGAKKVSEQKQARSAAAAERKRR